MRGGREGSVLSRLLLSKNTSMARPDGGQSAGLLHETFDGSLEVLDLVVELTLAVGLDGAGDHGAGDSAGVSEGNLAGDEYVVHVLLLADQRQVQQDLERLSVGGQNDEVSLLAVQGLSGCTIQSKISC